MPNKSSPERQKWIVGGLPHAVFKKEGWLKPGIWLEQLK